MIYDLHTHTTASDGKLSPDELLRRAIDRGVGCIAITDHDTVDGFLEIDSGHSNSIRVIPGIEFSCKWSRQNIHVLGLNIDTHNEQLADGIAQQKNARLQRAAAIAQRLTKLGIPDPMPEIRKASGGTIGRPHFAEHLVRCGLARDTRDAFRKYLGAGRTGDVGHYWPDLERVVGWVVAAGGTAIIAHPAHYKLTQTKLRALVEDFIDAGGRGIEVVSGSQSDAVTNKLSGLANDYSLLASCGSDFHEPDRRWSDLGSFAALPSRCMPVWREW